MMDLQLWLKSKRVSREAFDANALVDAFLDEMRRGLDGDTGSLAMIPAHISISGTPPLDTPVAVIDAGGTNLRIGLARFDSDRKLQICHYTRQALPGRDEEVDAQAFYSVLVDALAPLHDQFESVGFCFSYPATITPDHDGILLHWTKEIKIPEMVGQPVGAGLLDAFRARGISGKKVVVLNDTVATLLGGVAEGESFGASSYVGLILGTGTNTAYVEANRNIGKLNASPRDGSQVINVESGAFSRFVVGPMDRALDAVSVNPGKQPFEKVIAGVYMGPMTLYVLKALAEDGFFSAEAADALRGLEDLSTIDVGRFYANDGQADALFDAERFTDHDRALVCEVFRAVRDRAAMLTAVNITAAVVKSGQGYDPEHPVCVTIDGSTYYKTPQMAERVEAELKTLLAPRRLHVRCIKVEDAPIVGAAIAGLTAV